MANFSSRNFRIVTAFLVIFSMASTHAQTTPVNGTVDPDFEHVSQFMLDYMDTTGTTAATLQIRKKDGQVLLNQGYGWLDASETQETQADTMMRTASITKSFTHLAINQLVDASTISMSAKAFCLNSEVPSGTGCLLSVTPTGNDGVHDSRAEDITLQHLIDHAAGWDEGTADANGVYDPLGGAVTVADILNVQSPPTYQQMLDYQLDQALDYTPGTDDRYSNFGYVVLGYIIEQYSGKDFMEYVYDEITDDLSIAQTEIELGAELVSGRNSREPRYVSTDGTPVQNLFDPTGSSVQRPDGGILIQHAAGAGGMIATTSALLDYMNAYWLFDPSPRNPLEGWEWVRTGAGDGTLAFAVQNSPLPGLESQADWVVLLNKWPPSETLHAQLRALIRNTLTKDVAIGDNEGDTSSEQFFTLHVPDNAVNLEFTTQSGSGDIDLYVKFGAKPTTTNYDCRSINFGTSQNCGVSTPSEGTYYAMLLGNAAYSGVSIEGTYSVSGGGSCANVASGGNSGSFNTTGAYCFKTQDAIAGWGVSNFNGRSISVTVNGTGTAVTTPGATLPSKGSSDYYHFDSTAGSYAWAAVYWW